MFLWEYIWEGQYVNWFNKLAFGLIITCFYFFVIFYISIFLSQYILEGQQVIHFNPAFDGSFMN